MDAPCDKATMVLFLYFVLCRASEDLLEFHNLINTEKKEKLYTGRAKIMLAQFNKERLKAKP